MSRFDVDKFMRHVDDHGDRVRAFAADPAGYVATWLARGAASSPRPCPDGGTLTEAERVALETEDWETLYVMGAHPYVLFHLVVAVDLVRGPTPWPEFVEWYRGFVTPHGRPDFAT